MRKALDVIGLPVIVVQSGEEIGKIKDMLFDHQWIVQGYVVESSSWLKRAKFIPSDKVSSIGDDAVMVAREEELQTLERNDHLFGLTTGSPRIKGISVITENGNELGQVEDVYFLEEMGTLVGYELSEGLISDLKEGRRILRRPTHVTLGENALIIPVSSENDVGDQFRG